MGGTNTRDDGSQVADADEAPRMGGPSAAGVDRSEGDGPQRVPVLAITGPVGVGKTTVAGEVSAQLELAEMPHACVDLDALRQSYPAPPGDRFNAALGFRNLAAVWANYRAAGAERLIVATVIETRDDLTAYREAVPGADVLIVRLRAPADALRERVARRELGAGLEWHLARAAELAAQMERDAVEDLVVDTDGKPVPEVAREILGRSGWVAAPGG